MYWYRGADNKIRGGFKMIKAKVIQNYYERFGNFDKIHNSYTGKLLGDVKDPYEFLGYKSCSDKEHNFSAKEIHDLRMAYLREEENKIRETFNFASLEEASVFLKSVDMMPEKLESADIKIASTLKPYLNMLTEYYRNSNSYVFFKGNYLPLKDVLACMKFQLKAIKRNVKTLIEDNRGVLVSVETGELPLAYGRKLYVSKGLSAKQIDDLQSKALLKAALEGTQIPEKYVKDPLELFTISFSDTTTYLKILEMAELKKQTYTQYLENIGFHTPNCEIMFKELGIILAFVGERAVILMTNKEGNDTINFTTSSVAKQICSKILR